jgi:hypothetical protein
VPCNLRVLPCQRAEVKVKVEVKQRDV